ncbi:MAG: flagellar assembly protein FliX [Holosporales bacterium]|nr:flagellar assembly protein FliX [Holosporales bacterium]
MKIDAPAAVRRATYARNVRLLKRPKDSTFADSLGVTSSVDAENVGPIETTDATEALLCLQDVDQSLPDLTAFTKGKLTLRLLHGLQLSLLEGKLTRAQLQHLIAAVDQQEALAVKDSALRDILEDITLRARIELAKYDSLF